MMENETPGGRPLGEIQSQVQEPHAGRVAPRGSERWLEHIPAEPLAWADVPVRGAKRVAGLIDTHRERALRTRELATVCRTAPGADVNLDSLVYRGADPTEIESLFGELGWDRIATRIPRWTGGD